MAHSCTMRAYFVELEIAGVVACSSTSSAGPPMASSRPALSSSSPTVIGSAGSPAL
jgi:hypothetical protein